MCGVDHLPHGCIWGASSIITPLHFAHQSASELSTMTIRCRHRLHVLSTHPHIRYSIYFRESSRDLLNIFHLFIVRDNLPSGFRMLQQSRGKPVTKNVYFQDFVLRTWFNNSICPNSQLYCPRSHRQYSWSSDDDDLLYLCVLADVDTNVACVGLG